LVCTALTGRAALAVPQLQPLAVGIGAPESPQQPSPAGTLVLQPQAEAGLALLPQPQAEAGWTLLPQLQVEAGWLLVAAASAAPVGARRDWLRNQPRRSAAEATKPPARPRTIDALKKVRAKGQPKIDAL
jgi:hypothetical protein